MGISTTIDEIVSMNEELVCFWSSSHGWAPTASAAMLNQSRIDRNISLSKALRIWVMEPPEDESEARLILAWTNLGALIEVTLKLFLSAFLIDYRGDENAVKRKNGEIIDPDTLKLDSIRHFFDKNDLWTTEWSQFVLMVQQYRNAIHSFRDRSLGDFDKFWDAVRTYKSMIQEFNFDRLPYPDARY